MGTCNDNMKPSTKKSGNDVLNLPPRKEKKYAGALQDEGYTDNIARADTKLQELISIKTKDLDTEKGSEVVNALKLGNLKTQQFHLDSIIFSLSENPPSMHWPDIQGGASTLSTMFGNLLKRKRADKGSSVELYTESISKAHTALTKLIENLTKKKDKYLVYAETQLFHLDAIVDLMYAYRDDIK